MPKNKNAVIRYQVLDKCFANTGRKFYIDDLVEECNKILSDQKGADVSVKKRTVQNDIIYMESEAGMSIPLGVKATLYFSDIKAIEIILPPLLLQNQFATIIENIEAQKISLKASLKESEDLFG